MVAKIDTFKITDYGKVQTYLREDTFFEGSMEFKNPLQIDGRFEGDIRTTSSLIIGRTAVVKANILAQSVVVLGEIIGNVEATKQLEMRESGKVMGNIRTAKLLIAEGVVFDGHCEMIYPDKA